MRSKMRDVGVQKVPGYSWFERKREYRLLRRTRSKNEGEGYVSSIKLVLHDVEEEEKERTLKYLSENLAAALGILTIPVGRPNRVMKKRVYVCEDCRSAIKHMSKIVGRLITLRDSHRFNESICSCGEYW
ncbi:putative DYW domain-containing protein [Medicago truncatula]|uniref:Putative DYW domain-containing protein n=1 Tax=Medicago truncatula TaxID=3880 RepID=A0A396GYH9_MEDTR|nr:putative DYW domain-containing protein [Medicago truncatula]